MGGMGGGMRIFLLLLLLPLLSLPLQAAQIYSREDVDKISTTLISDSRFTHNTSTSMIYGWVRLIEADRIFNSITGGSYYVNKVRHCGIVALYSPDIFISDVRTLSLVVADNQEREVINPVNGIKFMTNAKDIEQDQASLDWCTQ